MLAERFLLLSLIALMAFTADVQGQELLQNLRNRFHNHSACASGNCASGTCGQQADCGCQNCAQGYGYQSGAYQPQPIILSVDPETGGISWVDMNQQPWMATPITPQMMRDSMGQPVDATGQPVDPTMTPPDGVPPIVAPGDATAPPVGPPAEQDFGDQFDLTSQFAGRGEVSGVRDLTIGDFFSGSGAIITGGSMSPITTIPIAGGDRRYKISDHFSPIPVNRVFFGYHGFGDATTDINGNQVDVQRYTFGLEKTYLDRNASFEIRIPFSHGLNNEQVRDFQTDGATDTEFGNLTLANKFLLYRRPGFACSTGAALIFPTADDALIDQFGFGTPSLLIENKAYEFLYYCSLHCQPTDNCWLTFTTQWDFNLQGLNVISDPGTMFEETGVFNDQNLFTMNFSSGAWFYNDPTGCNFIRGAAAIGELHYTTTMNDADIVTVGDGTTVLTNPFNRTDTINATIGLRLQVKDKAFATFAGVFPLRTNEGDRPFENEFNFNLSRLY